MPNFAQKCTLYTSNKSICTKGFKIFTCCALDKKEHPKWVHQLRGNIPYDLPNSTKLAEPTALTN